MEVKQLYTECLAQAAYYIESNGEAAIVDPLREVQGYIDMAQERGAKIKYVFETHFHADFVSGHITLSEKTGATIVFGATAQPNFEAVVATDGQEFKLGNVTIKALHTPGHTMESTTYLLIDEKGKEHAILSGDTLFLGDVGRPDLAQKAANMTQEELAGTLYDSLRTKIMTLPDEVIVYPGHGAGSACGKNMSKETIGSIGHEQANNYALRADMTKEEFVKEVTHGLVAPPAYFPLNVQMNKMGYESIDEVIKRGETAMSPDESEAAVNPGAGHHGAVMLDTRNRYEFRKEHIPRSIFIGIEGAFAPWVGALIKDVKQPILLIVDEDRLQEVITRLARVGFDNVLGHLKGGVEAWKSAGKEVDSVEHVTADDLAELEKKGNVKTVDVRKKPEFDSEHLVDSENAPLDFLSEHLHKFDEHESNYVYCAGGYRSVIAISILKARGIHNVIDVGCGFEGIKDTDLERSKYVCPTTLP